MGYNKGFHHNGVSQKGRPYLLILLMTFGAALFGVMVLHRFREKRIFNLLVKQKDHQLITLQLLLQVSYSLLNRRARHSYVLNFQSKFNCGKIDRILFFHGLTVANNLRGSFSHGMTVSNFGSVL